jgi:hypothetical protein
VYVLSLDDRNQKGITHTAFHYNIKLEEANNKKVSPTQDSFHSAESWYSRFAADGDLPAFALAGDLAPPVTLAGRLDLTAGDPGMIFLGSAGAALVRGEWPPALVLGVRGLGLGFVALGVPPLGTLGVALLPEALPTLFLGLGVPEGDETGRTFGTFGVVAPAAGPLFRFTTCCQRNVINTPKLHLQRSKGPKTSF